MRKLLAMLLLVIALTISGCTSLFPPKVEGGSIKIDKVHKEDRPDVDKGSTFKITIRPVREENGNE